MISLKIADSIFYRAIFWGYLVLMGTTLKLTLNLASISTVLIATLITLPFLAVIFKLQKIRLNGQDIFVLFVSCALMLSCFINITTQGISYIGIIQTLSFIFPWMLLICVIFGKEYILRNQPTFWKWFNNFIVILIFLGLLEYFACFYFGFVPPYKETANGPFFVGYTTIFHALETGVPHFRFYGPFGEPGELAMWASVLIVYNLFRRNYLMLGILMLASFLSASPAVYVSLLVAFGFYAFKSKSVISYATLFFVVLALWYLLTDIIYAIDSILITKESSLAAREEAFIGFFDKFDSLVLNQPFGISFFETTSAARSSGLSFAGNFTPILAFERGGIVAFVAYLLLLIFGSMVSFMRIVASKHSLFSNEIYVYFLMLLPFVVQRSAVLEFGLFPFLFSAIFLGRLRSQKRNDGLIFSR
ncbi:hypothetical protein OAK26_02075 [Gammaproteobacteria bacterium]|nr:hypothetical protein [Gammaproteobacteria bacterium]